MKRSKQPTLSSFFKRFKGARSTGVVDTVDIDAASSSDPQRLDPAPAASSSDPQRLDPAPAASSSDPQRLDPAPAASSSDPQRLGEKDIGFCIPGCPEVADPKDIGRLISCLSDLSDSELFSALNDRWIPPPKRLPSCKHMVAGVMRRRTCTKAHLEQFKWLTFSQYGEQTGAWCASCLLFRVKEDGGGRKGGGQTMGKLVTRPLRCFKNLTGKMGDLTLHASSQYHLGNEARAKEFLVRRQQAKHRIDIQLSAAKKVEEDRTVAALQSITDTVRLAATQNIALRGHRDDGRIDPSGAIPNDNDGNFRMLLRYRIRGGDEELAKHLRGAPSNALYTSKTSQNNLLRVHADMIKENIIQRVKESPFWCISADETTDRSSREQMTVTLRYVFQDPQLSYVVREDPVAVLDVFQELGEDNELSGEKRLTGANISKVLLCKIRELGAPIETLVGQSYDGAACMASARIGVAASVKEVAPMAEYFHCASHGFNLATSQMMKVPAIKNTIGTIENIVSFLTDSAKRTNALERGQQRAGVPQHTLKKMCSTRFIERHTAVERFVEQLPAIHETLLEMQQWQDPKASSNAALYLSTLQRSEFLVSLFVLLQVSELLLPISRQLQSRGADLMESLRLVEDVSTTMRTLRSDNASFSAVFNEAERALQSIGGSVLEKPRIAHAHSARAAAQPDHDSIPSEAESYFRANIFAPAVDYITSDLDARFGRHQQLTFALSRLVPKNVVSVEWEQAQPAWKKYQDLLHSSERQAVAEFTVWKGRWSRTSPTDRPETAIEALTVCDEAAFPVVSSMLRILATLPVSTAESERTFSKVNLTLTAIRATMTEERLESLILLQAHRTELPTISEVVKRFLDGARRH